MRSDSGRDVKILKGLSGKTKELFEKYLECKAKWFEELAKKDPQKALKIDKEKFNCDILEHYLAIWNSANAKVGTVKNSLEEIEERYKSENDELLGLWNELCESCQEFAVAVNRNENRMILSMIRSANTDDRKAKNRGTSSRTKKGPNKYLRVEEKRKYVCNIKEAILTSNMLEGSVEVLTYMELKDEDELLDITLSIGKKDYNSEEFAEIDRIKQGYSCEVISGGATSGKTVLMYRIAENVLKEWEKKPKDFMVIFFSAGSEGVLEGTDGRNYVSMFLNKSLVKRGRLIVILDGLDELISKGIVPSFKRLLDAARFYRSPLVISCRQPLFDMICKEEQNAITMKGTIQNVEGGQTKGTEKILKGFGTLSDKVIEEVLKNPYFVNIIKQKCPERVIEKKDELPQYFWNDYELTRMLFRALVKREKLKSELDVGLKSVMQKVAWRFYEYGEKVVTVKACFSRGSNLEQQCSVLESSFGYELVDMETDESNFADSTIKGFRNKAIGEFFLAEEYRSRLSGDKNAVKSVIKSILSAEAFDGRLNNILKGAVSAIPEDRKRKLLSILEKLRKESDSNNNQGELERIEKISDILVSV